MKKTDSGKSIDLLFTRSKFLFLYLIAILLIIEISLSNISDIIAYSISNVSGIILFLSIFFVTLLGKYMIYFRLADQIAELAELRKDIKRLYKFSIISQIIVDLFLAIIIFEVVFLEKYSTFFLLIITTMGYGTAIVNLTIISSLFFKWLKRSKSILILFYGLGTAFMVLNGLISVILFDVALQEKLPTVTLGDQVMFPGFEEGSPMAIVFSIQSYSNILYYVLMWLGTVILLRYKIEKIGKAKFYLFSVLPLVYFMSYYVTLYDTLNPGKPIVASVDLLGLILFFGYASMAGGIMVAFGFQEISKIVKDTNIKKYVVMTSLGFLLYFICGTASIGQAPFPPFGIVSISFLGLGSFLILNGLYLSAIHLSSDRNLRGIVKSAIDASRLMERIGAAQFNIEMEKVTLKVMQSRIQDDKQLKTTTLNSDKEIRDYIEEVLNEMKNPES